MDAVAILRIDGASERSERSERLEGLEARYERLLREHGPALRRATAGYEFDPARREDQEVIVKQMEQYFFGEGAAPPAQYVPPAEKKA